jgi:hypothetical protein
MHAISNPLETQWYAYLEQGDGRRDVGSVVCQWDLTRLSDGLQSLSLQASATPRAQTATYRQMHYSPHTPTGIALLKHLFDSGRIRQVAFVHLGLAVGNLLWCWVRAVYVNFTTP